MSCEQVCAEHARQLGGRLGRPSACLEQEIDNLLEQRLIVPEELDLDLAPALLGRLVAEGLPDNVVVRDLDLGRAVRPVHGPGVTGGPDAAGGGEVCAASQADHELGQRCRRGVVTVGERAAHLGAGTPRGGQFQVPACIAPARTASQCHPPDRQAEVGSVEVDRVELERRRVLHALDTLDGVKRGQ